MLIYNSMGFFFRWLNTSLIISARQQDTRTAIFCLRTINFLPAQYYAIMIFAWGLRYSRKKRHYMLKKQIVVIQFLPKNTRFTYRTKSPWFRNLNSHRKMFSRTSCSSKARNTTVIFYELRFIDFGEMMFSLSLSDT